MNRHWGIRLGDVAQFIRGLTYKPGDVLEENDAGAVPCMRTKNIQERLEDDDLIYIPDRLVRGGRWLEEGDILVSSANSWNLVGKCSWVPRLRYRATFGGFTSVLRADPRHIDARYLYHWFSWNHTQTIVRSFGQQTTNISNLNQNRCLDLALQLPPLDEQRRIAAILDKADALRQKRKRTIALLNRLTQSIFLDMFGLPGDPRSSATPQRPLGAIARLINGDRSSNYPSGDDLVSAGVLFLNTSNITPTGLDLTGANYITEQKFASLTRGKLAKNDLIITLRGSLGQTAIFENAGETGFINAQMMIVRPSDILDSRYLLQALQLDSTVAQLKRIGSGSAVPQLTAKQMSEFLIPTPDIEQQQAFARKSAALNAERARYVVHQLYVDDLFSSLQNRAFSGQL